MYIIKKDKILNEIECLGKNKILNKEYGGLDLIGNE